MTKELKMLLESEDYIQEAVEAKNIVKKYKSIMENLDYVCATIDKMEKLKDELMEEFNATRKLEHELYNRCKQKFDNQFALNEYITGVKHE